MADRYSQVVNAPLVGTIAKQLGLPQPVSLDRYQPGQAVISGPVLSGAAPASRLTKEIAAILDSVKAERAGTEGKAKALVFDATGIADSTELVELQRFFYPAVPRLQRSGRAIVLGTPPAEAGSVPAQIAQRALEGFTRSLGKEIGRGSTVNLVHVAPEADDALASTLAFFLSPKSAYVSGQVVRIGATGSTQAGTVTDPLKPLTGKVAIVTGASRGIGEQIARVLHRDGATVLGIDVPQAASELQQVMRDVDGDHLVLDITAKDAPQRIAQHVEQKYGGVDAIVHNAGITRDRRLANMKEDRFASVVAVNLTAPERITRELLGKGLVRENGRIVGVSSIAGIAGNVGQTNYATSKAGVIGLVDSLAGELTDGITVNAVAPGFIVTQMTAAVPFATREIGQRMNALAQGGQPVDVAETIAWYLNPGSTAVNGNVVRVCGQMMLGA
jgi:3-oxoacyl-[acyl-carrier protein] reductase